MLFTYRERDNLASSSAISGILSTGGAVISTNYTDSTVTNGQLYYYVVSAVNAGGVEGPNSTYVSAMPTAVTVPSPPTAVSADSGPLDAKATVTFSGASAVAIRSPATP